MRRLGVCNCPFRVGYGSAVCKLDGQPCKIFSDSSGIWCRGWLPNGKPSEMQSQGRLV